MLGQQVVTRPTMGVRQRTAELFKEQQHRIFASTDRMFAVLLVCQWLAAIGLALALPIVIEVGKAIRRRRLPPSEPFDVRQAVTPERAKATSTSS